MAKYVVRPENVNARYGFTVINIFDNLDTALEVCEKYNRRARRGLCQFHEVVNVITGEVVS